MFVRASVLVAALVGLAGTANADPQRVGFANGARSAKGAQTIIESLRMGLAHEGLSPLGSGELRTALEDPFTLAPEPSLDDAFAELEQAKEAYASFEYGPALAHLERVDEVLRQLPTTADLIDVVADRYLLAGLVFAGRGADAQAAEAFRVVQRLDSSRTSLDAGTYRPALVKLYRQALAARIQSVELSITAEPEGSRIWVDGKLMGTSRVSVEVAVGLHRVAANAPDHAPLSRMVEIEKRSRPVSMKLERPGIQTEIRRIRHELASGPSDDTAWKIGAARLADLSGVDLMIVVRNAGEGVFEGAIYRSEIGELGRWLPVPSSRFYSSISPAPERRAEPELRRVPPAALSAQIDTGDDPSWYSTWWGRTLIVGGAAVAIGAVVFAVTAKDSQPSVDIGDWCFGMECGL